MDVQAYALPASPCYVARMHSAWDKARFRRLLHRAMKDAGLSPQEVAGLAGVSRSQVSRWQSGAHRPNFDAMQKMASALRRDYPQTAGTADALMLAAGYQDVTQPATDHEAPDPDGYAMTGLTEDEYALVSAYLEGIRATAARQRQVITPAQHAQGGPQ